MTDYLLHPELVLDLCLAASSPETHELIGLAESRRDGLWIYLGHLPLLSQILATDLGRDTANARLKNLVEAVNGVSVQKQDVDLLLADSPNDGLGGLLGRLGDNANVLRKTSGEDGEITLADYFESELPVGVPFVDLAYQQRQIRARVESGLLGVLRHGRYIGGPEITELEQQLAAYVGVKHAFAVSNGTDALLIAMLAAGVKPGDEVITSPFTFAATGEMIHLLGARPVYVDIDPVTYNLDANHLGAAATEKTRAIIPVSIFGQCADMDAINQFGSTQGICVIEDAAQSFGATYKGRRSCAVSDIACTSFFPSKPLGGYGDSGAVFTDNDELATILSQVRDHGQSGRYRHARIGINGRMSSFQASVLLAKLELFKDEVRLRAEVGARYTEMLDQSGIDGESLVCPGIAEHNTSVYAQYSILVHSREAFQKRMQALGVPTAVHYPVPLNRQPAMQDADCKVAIAENVSGRVVSVPMHPYMSRDEQQKVVDAVVRSIQD